MAGTAFAWPGRRTDPSPSGAVPHRGGLRMRIRSLAILMASISLVTVGCATKKFVREEIGKSEAKIGQDVGRVEGALTEEKTRTAAMNDQLGQTKTAVEQTDARATEATNLARTAQSRADEGVAKATEAQSK